MRPVAQSVTVYASSSAWCTVYGAVAGSAIWRLKAAMVAGVAPMTMA